MRVLRLTNSFALSSTISTGIFAVGWDLCCPVCLSFQDASPNHSTRGILVEMIQVHSPSGAGVIDVAIGALTVWPRNCAGLNTIVHVSMFEVFMWLGYIRLLL